MNKVKLFSSSLLFSSALLLNVSVVQAYTVTVSGNGSDSDNTANVSLSQTRTITQSNIADVNNSATINSSTGNNTANQNTGGDTTINTGDASVALGVTNNVNTSKAVLACCLTNEGTVKISGNGSDSNNRVNVRESNNTTVLDTKVLNINNVFSVDATSGGNRANGNTGGDTTINTGDSSVDVTIGNWGNFNEVILGTMLPPTNTGGNTPPGGGPHNPPVALPIVKTNPGSVLAAANSLPMTGFELGKLVGIAFAFLGIGLVLRLRTEEIEKLLSFASQPKI